MARAYLVAKLSTDTGPLPVFLGVDIYSAGAMSLTGMPGAIFADIIYAEGKDYGDARKKLLDVIGYLPGLAWVRPWLGDSMAEHMAKSVLTSEVKRRHFYAKGSAPSVNDRYAAELEANRDLDAPGKEGA